MKEIEQKMLILCLQSVKLVYSSRWVRILTRMSPKLSHYPLSFQLP